MNKTTIICPFYVHYVVHREVTSDLAWSEFSLHLKHFTCLLKYKNFSHTSYGTRSEGGGWRVYQKIFLMCTILKVFIAFVIILLLFMFCYFAPRACRVSSLAGD